MARKNTDDNWEAEMKAAYREPGDYVAGEPPSVDLNGYYPREAPYPRDWTPDMRVDMTWWAQRNNARVDYDPSADDEGASGWWGAREAMLRDSRSRRAGVGAALAAGANPQPQLPPTPEPLPDPGEPRHPNPIGDW